ncbi:deoxyribonuclease IV [bacterium]|nr:deoxyribonuclease IV [bacterium]MBT5015230.1 deoxyribonuclease IV [bacterium]
MVGTHIRLHDTITNAINAAIRMDIPIFQTFLINSEGKRIRIAPEEIEQFKKLKQQFESIFIHTSYWVNLSSKANHGMRALERELTLALQLGLTKLIIHPGAAVGFDNKKECKQDGIAILVERLNTIMKKYPSVTILLENTTHANNCIGSDLNDFKEIFSQLATTDNVQLCIDTSHAYGYGYDISTPEGQVEFIQLIDDVVGIDKVGLIHLNDTPEELGKKIDRHAAPGHGNIGSEALKQFVNQEALKDIPIILELPVVTQQEEIDAVELVKSWRNL